MRILAVKGGWGTLIKPQTAAGKLTTLRVTTNQGGVAWFKQPPVLACAFGLLVVILFFFSLAGLAQAETEGTGWEAFTQAYPTNLHPEGNGTIQIDLMNVGAKESSGAITVTDILPEGVSATAAGGMLQIVGPIGDKVASVKEEEEKFGGVRWNCDWTGTKQVTVTCTSNPAYLQPLPIGSDPVERLAVEVHVEPGAQEATLKNVVSIAGGGATARTVVSNPVTLSSSEPGYGFSNWDMWSSNADGTLDTQAGSHPYETTFVVGYNELADARRAGGEFRNLEVELPPGFFGEPNSSPRCTRAQLDAAECPPDTQIGKNLAMLADEPQYGVGSVGGYDGSVFNMVPPPGVVDQFALDILGHDVFFDTAPRGYGDYRLITHINNIPATNLDGNILTLWGVSSEASHFAQRCTSVKNSEVCGLPSDAPARPFLTLPTSCEGPQTFTINGLGTWEDEGARARDSVVSHEAQDLETGFTGCSALSFEPGLSAVPETREADTPAGLAVNVTFPQEALRVPGGLTESTVKDTTVTLPAGLVINPGQAAGLEACTEAEARLKEEGAPKCPSASKVGKVEIQTPLLEGAFETELNGSVYVLAQSNGGAGEPPNLQTEHDPSLQLLIAASGDGVNLKLVANVALNEATGQLTTRLEKTPGLPFTHFELVFSGGAQAALATPAQCGSYTTTSDFTPWASPFASDQFPASVFQITGGPDGSACPSDPLPFSPSLIAGATNPKGDGFTNFSLLLQNGDGQQRIEKLQFKVPEGLSGMLSTVALCPEPQAGKGECTESSKIGHAVVASGPGPYPLVIPQPGNPESQIYLTGPYGGAPFGLSIVTHVIAGPFNLGTIVTRAKIEIDPRTAQITVTTNPLPQIIDGVPTDLRLVNSVIERPGFMFNPTHCAPSTFSGTAWGTPPPGAGGSGSSAAISTSFDVVGCKGLAFTPTFIASTSGKTSKSDGASLVLRVQRETGPASNQANFAEAKIELPKQLPSRLTTLQKACLAATFEADPASCPPESDIGHVKVVTPELPVPLEGPAYFVSHGGEAFPSVIFVLQGDNVTIDVVATTYISKSGITSSTIKAVPDAPFTSFELVFPEGAYSALGTNKNLCAPTSTVTVKKKVTKRIKGKLKKVTKKTTKQVAEPLKMPTEFIAQNGLRIHQSTPVTVTGCPKVHKAAKKGKANGKGKGKKKKK